MTSSMRRPRQLIRSVELNRCAVDRSLFHVMDDGPDSDRIFHFPLRPFPDANRDAVSRRLASLWRPRHDHDTLASAVHLGHAASQSLAAHHRHVHVARGPVRAALRRLAGEAGGRATAHVSRTSDRARRFLEHVQSGGLRVAVPLPDHVGADRRSEASAVREVPRNWID